MARSIARLCRRHFATATDDSGTVFRQALDDRRRRAHPRSDSNDNWKRNRAKTDGWRYEVTSRNYFAFACRLGIAVGAHGNVAGRADDRSNSHRFGSL